MARRRGEHAVTHSPLTNPRVRPSPERVRGGSAPAAAAGVRRPAWRGSLRQAARPGNRVRRAGGPGVAPHPHSPGDVHTAARLVRDGGPCSRLTDRRAAACGRGCVRDGRLWPSRGKRCGTKV